MARIELSPLVVSARGNLGGLQFTARGGTAYVKNRTRSAGVQSAGRRLSQQKFKDAWGLLRAFGGGGAANPPYGLPYVWDTLGRSVERTGVREFTKWVFGGLGERRPSAASYVTDDRDGYLWRLWPDADYPVDEYLMGPLLDFYPRVIGGTLTEPYTPGPGNTLGTGGRWNLSCRLPPAFSGWVWPVQPFRLELYLWPWSFHLGDRGNKYVDFRIYTYPFDWGNYLFNNTFTIRVPPLWKNVVTVPHDIPLFFHEQPVFYAAALAFVFYSAGWANRSYGLARSQVLLTAHSPVFPLFCYEGAPATEPGLTDTYAAPVPMWTGFLGA